ncbi:MAG: hypothetical protein ACM3U2_09870 [Deltaproteobacteria bacterium]
MQCDFDRLTKILTAATRIVVLILCLLSVSPSRRARAEDAPPLELHEWSVWLGEPQGKSINSLSDYTSAMPGVVETDRSRRRESEKPAPSPLGVMALYGEPPEVVDIDLRIAAGRPVAQWPRSEGKSNRLRWLDLKLSKELTNREALAYIPEGHWFHRARDLGGLYLQLKKGGRIERFLAYDLEFQTTLTVRVDGGPEQYKIANLGKHALHDVLLIVPGPEGRRLGWVDKIGPAPGAPGGTPANQPGTTPPAGQPAAPRQVAVVRAAAGVVVAAPGAVVVNQPATPPGASPHGGQPNPAGQPATQATLADIPLSDPLAADSDEYKEKTSGELRKRLAAAGLKEAEINLLHSLYAKHFFESDGMQLVFRMPQEAIDEMTPLTVEPENTKVKRVALVIARNVNPRLRDDVQKLVAELGDSSYAKREQAEKRLKDLGRLAIPSLKEALKNKDLEVVMRAERLLLLQKEPLGAE